MEIREDGKIVLSKDEIQKMNSQVVGRKDPIETRLNSLLNTYIGNNPLLDEIMNKNMVK